VPVARLRPGVSLVTCSRNRSANLIRALPSWLACPEISEVVVVDWGSDRPVADELAAAGLTDPRIRVARAEGEARWILSYAFNLGFRLARFDHVLKADADIVLGQGFFAANPLPPASFIAGNWRRAGPGQSFVNGFFYLRTAGLMAINGFNEYITTYGWDDDDLYDRLVAAGTARVGVADGTVTHLDHDDVARLNQTSAETPSGWTDLAQTAMYKIRTNRMIATIMPPWNRDRIMLPFRVQALPPGRPTRIALVRGGGTIHFVPPEQQATAERLAASEMLAWRAGLRAYELTWRQLDLLLTCRRLEAIQALQVELMLSGAGLAAAAAPRHLVADLDEGALAQGPAALAPLAERVLAAAQRSGRCLVWRLPRAQLPAGLPTALTSQAFVPSYYNIGATRDITLDEVRHDQSSPVLRLRLSAADLAAAGPPALPPPATTLAPILAPTLAATLAAAPPPLALPAPGTAPGTAPYSAALAPPRRDRLFIDAQHGLGNRLRAIGSAAAVAQATGREVVLVWQPDHHCQARITDLFRYDGAVIAESFLPRAAADGLSVLNCMEIEPGATRGAALVLTPGRDAYVRSAYVIAHPASTWDSENRLLHRLQPAPAVADLMAGAAPHRDIGLHVRMEGAPGSDTASYDAARNWTPEGHAAINHWRGQSHHARFMARLDALLADRPDARVFLAADLPATYRAFAETYGDRVAGLDRTLFDRSAQQAQYGLADILLLARCRHLLGSNWSSFTEAALRFSTTIKAHERAGVEF